MQIKDNERLLNTIRMVTQHQETKMKTIPSTSKDMELEFLCIIGIMHYGRNVNNFRK